MTLNSIYNKGYKAITFPDGQPHVVLDDPNVKEVQLIHPIRNPYDLYKLLALSNALTKASARKKELVIPYLMGARSDREMVPGDSIDLQVVAECINSCNFESVLLYDVHSPVALQLIKNSINIIPTELYNLYKQPNAVLVCPDKGATKRVNVIREHIPSITDVIYCDKERELSSGKLKLTVKTPGVVRNRPYIIVDDLCDGGGTFNLIAEQLRPYNPDYATLMVTHGIFSQGFDKLKENFNTIYTTNSYNEQIHRVVETLQVF